QVLTYAAPQIPIVSNVTGQPAGGAELCSPDHWVNHVRQPVRFRDGVRWLAAAGVDTFLELGPDAVLSAMGPDCLDELTDAPVFVPVLRRDRAEQQELLAAVAQAHARGASVDWAAFFAGRMAHRLELPTYAFQRRRFWLSAPVPT